MSKRSDQIAQLRKQRAAEAVRGTRPIDVERVPPDYRRPSPGFFAGMPKWKSLGIKAVIVVVGLSILSGLLSLLLPPLVPTPPPFMVSIVPQLEIVNQSLLPIHGIRYTCQLASLTDQSGFAVGSSAEAQVQPAPTLYPRQRVPIECSGQPDLRGIRLREVDLKVSISYFHFGWPIRRHTDYTVKGDLDNIGGVRRWQVD
jgi:hypothetical protein